MWNTVLFDLDGTLTESGEGITRCVQYALRKEFDIQVENLHDLDCFVGPPLKEQFKSYANLSDEEADRAIRAYRERYRTRGIYKTGCMTASFCFWTPWCGKAWCWGCLLRSRPNSAGRS